MSRFKIACLLALASAPLLLGQAGVQTPEQKAVVKQVFDDWAKRRSQFKNVRYAAKGTVYWPKRTIGGRAAGDDGAGKEIPEATVPREVSILFDFTRKLHRMQLKQSFVHESGKWFERENVGAFDGKKVTGMLLHQSPGAPPPKNDGGVVTGNLRDLGPDAAEWALYMAHGIVTRNNETRIIPGKWEPKLDSKEVYVRGRAKHQGTECVVLRTEMDHVIGEGCDEYWVDPARGHLLVRYAAFVQGKQTHAIDLEYGEGPSHPLKSWRFQVWARERLHQAHEMKVESFEADPQVSEEDFRIAFKPGMRINRQHRFGSEDAILPDERDTVQILSVATDGTLVPISGTPPPSEGMPWWRQVLALVLPVLVLATAIVYWRMARRRAAVVEG